mmetsp:Transcript_39486/g.118538  ORF Transcript_39486/g.118538 Transcript_39486/m.118538 type:complete len:127 (+) Transcript_39486:670-1050(+)
MSRKRRAPCGAQLLCTAAVSGPAVVRQHTSAVVPPALEGGGTGCLRGWRGWERECVRGERSRGCRSSRDETGHVSVAVGREDGSACRPCEEYGADEAGADWTHFASDEPGVATAMKEARIREAAER